MGATVYIPTPLRSYVGNRESLELEGNTVREILAHLSQEYEGLRKHLV